MNIGFSVIVRGAEVQFRQFGSDAMDRPPLCTFARRGQDASALLGRLYYREDVMARLPAELTPAADCNDAELALAVYRHAGADGLSRLEGDFALAVWDGTTGQLLACRDALGGFPLFWAKHAETFILSTRQRPLLDLLPQRRLNADYLAEFLMLPGCGFHEIPQDLCAYEGVHRVLAGHLLRVRQPGAVVETQRCWDWLEEATDPGTDRVEDVAVEYRQLLREAVRQRLRYGTTASHLSGGVDSTSVALVGQELVDAGAADGPIHGLSMVFDTLPLLSQETPYLDEVLRGRPEIVAHRIAGEKNLDFDDLARTPMMDEPCPFLPRLGGDRVMTEVAGQAGAVTVLTGLGADEMLDMPPNHIAELLCRGRLLKAWSEARDWGRVLGRSGARIFCEYGLTNLMPSWLHDGLGHASWKKQSDYSVAPWVEPEFARRHAMPQRGVAHLQRMRPVDGSLNLARALHNLQRKHGDFNRWYAGLPHGVVISHPFLDTRVLRLGLGLQKRFPPKAGQPKRILVEAMRDLLPESIRTRKHKGNFNEIYFMGLARNRARLETLIEQAPVDSLGLIRKDVLRECLQKAALGMASDVRALDRLTLTLALLHWLTQQETIRCPIPEEVSVVAG